MSLFIPPLNHNFMDTIRIQGTQLYVNRGGETQMRIALIKNPQILWVELVGLELGDFMSALLDFPQVTGLMLTLCVGEIDPAHLVHIYFLKLTRMRSPVIFDTLANCPSVKKLIVVEHPYSLKTPKALRHIEHLVLIECGKITTFPTGTRALKTLTMRRQFAEGTRPFDVDGVDVRNLEKLSITNCDSEHIVGPHMTGLKGLTIRNYKHIDVALRAAPRLMKLTIWSCPSLEVITFLPPNLRMLDIEDCTALRSLPHVTLRYLYSLYMNNCPLIDDVSKLPLTAWPEGVTFFRVDGVDVEDYTAAVGNEVIRRDATKRGGTVPFDDNVLKKLDDFVIGPGSNGMKWKPELY